MNRKKQLMCIIEHQDALDSLIHTDYTLGTHLKKTMLNMLIESNLFDAHAMVWISITGILKGINCHWTQELNAADTWITASTIATKTDALALRCNPEKNSFDIVLRGNMLENLTSTNCKVILLQYLNKSTIFDTKRPTPKNRQEKCDEKNHA